MKKYYYIKKKQKEEFNKKWKVYFKYGRNDEHFEILF